MKKLILTTEAARLLGVHHRTLRNLHQRAPRGLPGEPLDVGVGAHRALRWDPDRLHEWVRLATGRVRESRFAQDEIDEDPRRR